MRCFPSRKDLLLVDSSFDKLGAARLSVSEVFLDVENRSAVLCSPMERFLQRATCRACASFLFFFLSLRP